MTLTKRQERLERILDAIEKMAGEPLETLEPFHLGEDPLRQLVAEVRSLWKVGEALHQSLHLPDDEATENRLILAW